jgi:hypothetical protein
MTNGKRGRPKNPPKFKELLQKYIPADEIFDEHEHKMYEGLVGTFLRDFDESQLTANDMDDIMSIAMNRVLEIRILKSSKSNPTGTMDASIYIDKIRKNTEKLKDNLAARRKDRIDPKKFGGFSIVDLAVNFDTEKKKEVLDRAIAFKAAEKEALKSEMLIGNRRDEDADVVEKE